MKIFLPFLLSPLLSAEIVDVTLTLSPVNSSQNTLSLDLTAEGISSSDSSQASGTVEARLDIDPESGEISAIQLLSGDVTASPVQFIGRVFFFTVYNISTSTLGATVVTPSGLTAVSNGQSPAELHTLTINEGTLSGSAAGSPIPEQNFEDTPVSGDGPVGSFVEITSTLNSASTVTNRLFDLNFSFPVDIDQDIETAGVSATINTSGNIDATGQASLTVEPPNPYLTWAEANGITNAVFTDNDFSNQLPNGLLWALGYDGSDSPEVLCAVANGSGTFTLNLPASGSAAEVVVQSSTDLSDPNSWSTLATIPAGTTAAQGPFGGGAGPEFLRLLAEDPAE